MDSENKKMAFNRRNFLKTSVLTAAGASLLGFKALENTGALGNEKPKSFSLLTKEHNTIDDVYEISVDYKRMDQRNTIFCRGAWDAPFGGKEGMFPAWMAKWTKIIPNSMDGEPGFGNIEHALDLASWAGHDAGTILSAASIGGMGPLNNWDTHANPSTPEKHIFNNKTEAATYIKRASKFLGADQVGIAPFDERWVYSKGFNLKKAMENPDLDTTSEDIHTEIKLPFKPKSVISFAFEMDYDAIRTPGYMGDGAAGLEYSHMTEVTHKVAVFLNHLGYKAIPCGNDTGLSIPIAIQAGIGELSRMGTLISEKYGSRVRLAKVFTDLEMDFDKPITFGVQEFCEKCMKCADKCPSNAISTERKPSIVSTTGSKSSNSGVKKWYQDNERCFSQWEKLGAGCSICLAVCPYNKIDTWAHDLSKLAVGIPVGRDIARQLDDAFGYGEIKPENVNKFWTNLDDK